MNGHPHGEQLSAYVDGMLDVAQMRDVATHLAFCPQCQAMQQGLGHTKQLLREMNTPPLPAPEFWADTYRRMRVGERSRRETVPLWERLRETFRAPQRRWSAGVAAVAVVAAAVAAPWMSGSSWNGVTRPSVTVSTQAADSVDVSALVQAHTESAARQPLADPDRQDMIAMDTSFAGDDAAMSPSDSLGSSSDTSP